MSTHQIDSKGTKEIAETYVARIWNDQDLTAIDDFVSDKCVIHSSLGEFIGKSHLKTVVQTYLKAFPDISVKNNVVIAENDLVAVQWEVKATHQGEFKDIKPTGRQIAYSGVTIYRINHDKIVEYWAYLDLNHILKQIK